MNPQPESTRGIPRNQCRLALCFFMSSGSRRASQLLCQLMGLGIVGTENCFTGTQREHGSWVDVLGAFGPGLGYTVGVDAAPPSLQPHRTGRRPKQGKSLRSTRRRSLASARTPQVAHPTKSAVVSTSERAMQSGAPSSIPGWR